jgi:hypothetical protein
MRVEYVNEGESELMDNEENKAKGNRIGRMGRNQIWKVTRRDVSLCFGIYGTPVLTMDNGVSFRLICSSHDAILLLKFYSAFRDRNGR